MQGAPAVLPMATLAQGAMSNIDEPRQVIVRSSREWQALWREHDAGSALPAVDFGQSMVVGVFLGSRPSAGYAAEIAAVKKEGDRFVVEYREVRPPPDAFTAQVLTFPFHLARIPRSDAQVEFRRLPS